MSWEFLLSLLAFSIVIMIHEFGHYAFARMFGLGIKTFSIGMGKAIHSFIDKRGTKWQICMIPLGGYVYPKETEEENAQENVIGTTFEKMHPLKGIFFAFAGPLFNFLSAFLIMVTIAIFVGFPKFSPEIIDIMPNSVAIGKLLPGDIVLEINNKKVEDALIGEKDPVMKIKRGQQILDIQLKKAANEPYKLVFATKFEKVSAKYAIVESIKHIVFSVANLFQKIWGAIVSMNIVGPIGIIKKSMQVQQYGFIIFLLFIANISISIGAFNLLPIPILDGGRIIMFMLSMIIRRPIPMIFQKVFSYISIAILAVIFLLGFFVDIKGLL